MDTPIIDLGVCPIVVVDETTAALAAAWAQAMAEAALSGVDKAT